MQLCGCLDLAEKVFDNMLERSMVAWNVMIDAFVQSRELVLMKNLLAFFGICSF